MSSSSSFHFLSSARALLDQLQKSADEADVVSEADQSVVVEMITQLQITLAAKVMVTTPRPDIGSDASTGCTAESRWQWLAANAIVEFEIRRTRNWAEPSLRAERPVVHRASENILAKLNEVVDCFLCVGTNDVQSTSPSPAFGERAFSFGLPCGSASAHVVQTQR